MKNRTPVAVAFVAGLVAGIALQLVFATAPPTIEAHSELQSVNWDHVQIATFASDSMTFTAQRSLIGSSLDVTATYADGKAVQHCKVGAEIARRLLPLAHIIAVRGLSADERERRFPAYVGTFTILTFGQENDGPIMVFSSHDGAAIAFVAAGYIAEVSVPSMMFRELTLGCN